MSGADVCCQALSSLCALANLEVTTKCDDETVGILYEGSRAHMTFQRVKLKDIFPDE